MIVNKLSAAVCDYLGTACEVVEYRQCLDGTYYDVTAIGIGMEPFVGKVDMLYGKVSPRVEDPVNTPFLIMRAGREIAAGGGKRRPRLKCVDWAGIIWCNGDTYRVSVRWPDGAKWREIVPKIKRID